MAISHNIITSGTRGSIGDVTLRQQDGKTVISQKASVVSNPKSYAQALQRMRMAAVTKFYSPLSAVLEQAWQGKNTRQSYSEFLSSALRTIAEYNPPIGVRRSWPFFPLPVQVSRGSLRQFPYALNAAGTSFAMTAWSDLSYADNIGGLSKMLIDNFGMQNGDYCTFLLVIANSSGYQPVFFRITLDTQSTVDLTTFISTYGFEAVVTSDVVCFETALTGQYIAAGAVILSAYRRGVWRRSTQSLAVAADYVAVMQSNFEGSIYDYMSTEASQGAPASDVYLNGDTSRRASSDDSSIIDPSSLLFVDAPTSAGVAIPGVAVRVVPVTYNNVAYLGVEFDNNGTLSSYIYTPDDHTTAYNKLFRWPSCDSVNKPSGFSEDVCSSALNPSENSANVAQWLSDQTGVPMSRFLFG